MSTEELINDLVEEEMHETAEVVSAWSDDLKKKYNVPDEEIAYIFDRIINTVRNEFGD